MINKMPDTFVNHGLNKAIRDRIAIERRIVRQVIKSALEAGYVLKVDNGGDDLESMDCSTVTKAMRSMMLTDEDRLFLFTSENVSSERYSGWVYFVYGNDGWDVICDYTCNLEDLLKASNDLADKLSA